jgi:hypothetical protein
MRKFFGLFLRKRWAMSKENDTLIEDKVEREG